MADTEPLVEPDPLELDTPPAPPPITDPTPVKRGPGRPKGSGDRKPRRTRTRSSSTAAAKEPTESQVDRKLKANLEFLLLKPAEVSRSVGFAFGTCHFAERAKPTADLIVKASHDWDDLRAALTAADRLVSGKVLFAGAVAAYLLPAILAATGRDAAAFMLSSVSPEQVAAVEMLMTDSALAAHVHDLRASGLDDDQIAATLNGNAAAGNSHTQTRWPAAGPADTPSTA